MPLTVAGQQWIFTIFPSVIQKARPDITATHSGYAIGVPHNKTRPFAKNLTIIITYRAFRKHKHLEKQGISVIDFSPKATLILFLFIIYMVMLCDNNVSL